MARDKLILVFDGTCGFCTRSLHWVQWLDRQGNIDPVPFQNVSRREALGLTLNDCENAAWTIRSDGTRHRGPAAVLDATGWAIGWKPLVRLAYVPGISGLMNAAYRWVARNRHRFPGHTPHCRKHPEDCGHPIADGRRPMA